VKRARRAPWATYGVFPMPMRRSGPRRLCCVPNLEAGFEAWYRLIRKVYVDQWKLTTFDQVISKYAPGGDGNNEAGYVAALKHAVDVWNAGGVLV